MDDRGDIDHITYIYGCHLSAGEVFPVSTYQSMKMFPSVYGDLVTWLDFRKVDLSTLSQQPQPVLNTEIYGCNLSSLLEFAITDDEIMQDMPGADMYNDTLVWSECNEGLCVIYSYDLLTQTKATLSTSHDALVAPAIYGNVVVWNDYRNGNGDIYGYNIKTGEEFAICTDPGQQQNPAIYENIVVWEDDRNELPNTYDIYGARLTFDNP
jgi:beta propeller repeat protein